MAKNEKIRVSTLDEWHAALAGMYNALKNENANRYITDVGKDYESSSKLNSGAKAKVEHINHIINGINALNGKDSEGNIPTDKDDLIVYFWYSDWSQPPGEITVGKTKVKIVSQLRKNINDTVSELKQICVNNSKNKVLFNFIDGDHAKCIDYICTDNVKDCHDNSTIVNATTPTNSRTTYATSYDSKTVKNTIGTVTISDSNKPNTTVKKVTTNSVKPKDNKECTQNTKESNSKTSWHYNCSQYGITCPQNITNPKYYTNGKKHGYTKTTSNVKNTKYSKTKGYTKDAVKTNSVTPGDSKTTIKTTNSTAPYDVKTSYVTSPRNSVSLNSTIVSYSYDTGDSKKENTIRISHSQCSQDIRCQTYNIGYSVKINKDGSFKTYKYSDNDQRLKLNQYLFIPEEK